MIIDFANAFLSVTIKKENQKQLHSYDAENIPLQIYCHGTVLTLPLSITA